MNGLEAIKAMQEGKIVIYNSPYGTFLNKIIYLFLFLFLFFETRFLCVALAVLELTL